jgi:hypothetical protein
MVPNSAFALVSFLWQIFNFYCLEQLQHLEVNYRADVPADQPGLEPRHTRYR